jgi:uncharacterized protein YbjT (DUF2867 family)
MNTRTALMLGASGLVGHFCIETLVGDSAYGKVISIGRRELLIKDPKLVQKIADFNSLPAVEIPVVDDVFCALGTTIRKAGSQQAFRQVDFEFPVAAAQQSLKAGAKQFILVSSIGADPNSKNFYLRTKGEVEQALQSLPFTAVHIFRPSLLLGKRAESRPGESVGIWAARVLQYAMAGSLRKYRPITAAEVGRAMVAAAKTSKPGVSVYEFDAIRQLASQATANMMFC